MLTAIKKQVWKANLDLGRSNLVVMTFGNVSGIDRREGLVAIKPSGVSYESLRPQAMVLVDLEGKIVEGKLNPSSDTPAHLELYKAFREIGGIAHAHSEYATIFAQAGREIPCLGTTHADYFNGPVPVTRFLRKKEVEKDYEASTGRLIAERFKGRINPMEMPAVLVAGHGPFCWGKTPAEALEHNLILEKIAKMALGTILVNPGGKSLPEYLLRKHYQRKHGPHAYYGQKKGAKK